MQSLLLRPVTKQLEEPGGTAQPLTLEEVQLFGQPACGLAGSYYSQKGTLESQTLSGPALGISLVVTLIKWML